MVRVLNPKPALPMDRQLFSNNALKAMIVPLLIEQLLQLVVGIADTMMVSYAGEATVSGVSLDTMIYTIFIYLFTAVATGAAVIVSQYIGRGRELYLLSEPSVTDVMCEIACFNHCFFLTLSQKSASKAFYEAFLAELDAIGVPFEVMRSEPLHLCGVRYDGLEGVKL